MCSPDSPSNNAPLYALQALDGAEQTAFEQALARSPTLQQELAQLQNAVAALAYSVPLIAIAPELRQQLLSQLLPAASLPEIPPAWSQWLAKTQPLPWQPHPNCAELDVVLLSVDYSQRRLHCLLRAQTALTFPNHRHRASEEMIVLGGDLVVGEQIYHRGDRIVSVPGSSHAPRTEQGCLLFIDTGLDNEVII